MLSHKPFERHSAILLIGILIVVSIGGIVQLAPLFYLENTIEEVEGVRPYSPLELMGRDIYVREGCYVCHSQMIRPLRDEVERYGHYSLAAESMYDRPFQWGSKRTGPDLARVGGKYSDEWHRDHFARPREMVQGTVMPPYAFFAKTRLDMTNIEDQLKTLKTLGVPYTDAMIANAKSDIATQLDRFSAEFDDFLARYPKAVIRDFDGDPSKVTELDAVIAYLQVLGTLVDFSTYEPAKKENIR